MSSGFDDDPPILQSGVAEVCHELPKVKITSFLHMRSCQGYSCARRLAILHATIGNRTCVCTV